MWLTVLNRIKGLACIEPERRAPMKKEWILFLPELGTFIKL